MIRFLLIVAAFSVLIIVGIVVALSAPMPMIPYSQPAGPMTGLGGPMIPGNVGSGSAPVTHALLANTGQPIYSVGTTAILVQ
jgi:hypothetical protein